jgi:hypothetical protein
MKIALQKVHRVATVATYPLHILVCRIPSARRQKAIKLGAGGVIMLIGVVIAKNPYHLLNHIVADVIGYGLHAYGSCPFIKILCAKFDLEDLNETRKNVSAPEIDVANITRDRAWRNL